MTDGEYTYHRMPIPNSTCDFHFTDFNKLNSSNVRKAELGTHLKQCKGIPHFREPRPSTLPQYCNGQHLIYSLENDPDQKTPINDHRLERELTEKLRILLQQAEAPDSQFERLAIERSAEQSVAGDA